MTTTPPVAPALARTPAPTPQTPAVQTKTAQPASIDSFMARPFDQGGETPMTDGAWARRTLPGLSVKAAEKSIAERFNALGKRQFVFTPDGLQAVAEVGRKKLAEVEAEAKRTGDATLLANKHAIVFDAMLDEVVARYADPKLDKLGLPRMKLPLDKNGKPQKPQLIWDRNDAGGAVTDIAYVMVSKTEYLLFLWAPCKSPGANGTCDTQATGFSGRYKHLDIYDYLVKGTVLRHKPGTSGWSAEKPGDVSYLHHGDAWDYNALGLTMQYSDPSKPYSESTEPDSDPGVILVENGRGKIGFSDFWFGMIQSWLGKTNDGKGTAETIRHALDMRIRQSNEAGIKLVRALLR
jgi:hypothetical protein